ncbi:hypothetical protein GIB67_007501 [Kingdonia uniflora]|uniref:Uncharacterized protein n=1 Tax=Kingdonia uniflora TaxID=39325 RepID=A0A7J7LW16_9MAGN|nr:hypothetical protein GIB67_007501 [Kingdonia uniflora]
MAESETQPQNSPISINEDKKLQIPFLPNFPDFHFKFPDFKLNFPQFNQTNKDVAVAPTTTTTTTATQGSKVVEGEAKVMNPDVVRVSESKKTYPSIKLEVEESEQGISPKNMWQVYVLGGFMIARWMWAKWKESKANKPDPSEDEEPTPTDD